MSRDQDLGLPEAQKYVEDLFNSLQDFSGVSGHCFVDFGGVQAHAGLASGQRV